MKEAADNGADWAEGRVTTAAVADGFAADTVFLSGECECDKRCGEQVRVRTAQGVETAMADPETDVVNTKEVVGRRSGCTTVFARAQEEEEGNEQAIAGRGEAQRERCCGGESVRLA